LHTGYLQRDFVSSPSSEFFCRFLKKFSTELPVVIGFKPEKPLGSGEDGQAVKLEFWVVETGRAAIALRVILAVFNELRPRCAPVSRKAQGGRGNPPIQFGS